MWDSQRGAQGRPGPRGGGAGAGGARVGRALLEVFLAPLCRRFCADCVCMCVCVCFVQNEAQQGLVEKELCPWLFQVRPS